MNRHAVGLLALAVAGTAIAQAQQPSAALATYLRDNIGFTPAQIAAMERGEVVVKVLPSTNDRDVVVFGIVTAPVSRAAYVAIAKNFRTSLAGPNRPQLGIFSDPPVAADLQSLVVSKDEAADLEKCKPGDCAMKLPLADMRTLHAQIRWASPTLSADLSAFARKRFLEYATDYRQRGDAAMAVFADRGNVSARAAFADILDDSPYVYQHVPSVTQYLIAYPRGRLPDATEVLYWSQDILPRLRPIISITHEVIVTPPELKASTMIAAKQIYANHYFEAAIELTVVTDRVVAGSPPGVYLLTLRRYRFDNLPGGLLNIKGRATDALRDRLADDLRGEKARHPPG